MRIRRETEPKRLPDELWLAGFAFHGTGVSCQSGDGRPKQLGEMGNEEDAELIYEQLRSHAGECGTCWPWRNQLWAVQRLCPSGAALC